MGSGARPTDVVVVGLGAAGGIAAHVLTEAGLKVVAVEAGTHADASVMTFDEIRNDFRSWLAEPKAIHEVPTWRGALTEAAGPSPWPMLMVNAIGGTTVHYDGMSPRLLPWNFEARSRVLERYGAGAVPVDSTLADWPLSYDELEPYYDAVEYAIGVSGTACNVGGSVDPRGNYFEASRRRGYPMPPLRRTGWSELMDSAGKRLGWHPYPCPAAINSQPYNDNPECTYCGFCQGNGCYRNAKGSTSLNVIPRAEATRNLTVVTSARVTRIEVDADGLVSGVRYVKDGREHFQPAAVVLVGTFTYENTRLLLLSKSKPFPSGLANSYGQVGRHFMAHVTPFAFGVFPDRNLNTFSGTMAQATCLDDWNADNFDHSGLGFIGGGMLASLGEAKPIAAATMGLPPGIPGWGSDWKSWLKRNAQSVGGAGAQFDSLAYEGTYLDLDPVAKDPYGVPVVRMTHRLHTNEIRGAVFLVERLKSWLREAGAAETWVPEPQFVEARHAYGGTRMGADPETSVVDRYGFAHEVPNLGVIGASTLPTAGGHNPTLTLQALAWRTTRHLIDDWRSIAPTARAEGSSAP
jgi:gluconate 2-dehydrogenase alpha chain